MDVSTALTIKPVATFSAALFYATVLFCLLSQTAQAKFVGLFAPPLSPNRQLLAPMDSVRGLAATYVALGHAWYFTYPVFAESQLSVAWLAYGAKAVPIFCILSGFLIYRSVIAIKDNEDLKYYAIARFFRIYPLYLMSVILVLLFDQMNRSSGVADPFAYTIAEVFMFRAVNFPLFANPVT